MFTGIIEEVGAVKNIAGGRIVVAAKKVLDGIHIGYSVAVNGICLTATEFGADYFAADVMPETFRRTSLAETRNGSRVNLERALTLSARLGGHIVSGHIDGAGKIVSFAKEKNAVIMKIAADEKILRLIVEKGSVALDGISLTVADVSGADFAVSLIPQTMKETNLAEKKVGSLINIETDIIGKYVAKLLHGTPERGITADFLRENGF